MLLCYRLRILNIAIDADGSPSGYITWHNHFTNKSKIRTVRPSIKNERYGVQRMEMLAIYFAIVDNLRAFKKLKRTRQIIIVRSDSKSTIEQLNEKTEIKDNLILRIYNAIKRMLGKVTYTIVFDYQSRKDNRKHLPREVSHIIGPIQSHADGVAKAINRQTQR